MLPGPHLRPAPSFRDTVWREPLAEAGIGTRLTAIRARKEPPVAMRLKRVDSPLVPPIDKDAAFLPQIAVPPKTLVRTDKN